jgi:cytochrome c553
MKSKLVVILAVALGCLSVAVAYDTASSFDGQNPPHAVDTAGKTIPDSSATQPDKPFILSKDSVDPKWGELKPEMTFDHTKHNTDAKHTLDGQTATACVYCHHTEQPMPVAGKPFLKKSERSEVLTAAQLETSKQAVNSCRHCHFQDGTAPTGEYPPKSVRYPREMGLPPSGKLTNDNAYHTKCISCHDAAMKRDPQLKAPQGCGDCHVNKSATPAATATLTPTPTTTATP